MPAGSSSVAALDPAAHLRHALDLAARHLGHRDRTVAEMRRHLEAKGVEPTASDGAIAELARLGYLDDVRFAQRYAEDRRALDGWGPERIERKLRDAGVAEEQIAAALATQTADEALDAALEILCRRMPQRPRDDRDRERALGMLVRRGYELELAHSAVRAYERLADRPAS